MRVIQNTLHAVSRHIVRQTEESAHQITLFAMVMMINFPLFGILWNFERFQLNQEFCLRLIASGLCALLVLHKFWSAPFLKFLPLVWYVTLLFCLPFFFSYLTLLNNGSTLWLMNCVSAIFFLLLVTNVLDSLILLLLGISLAFIYYFYGGVNTFVYVPGHISLYSLSITFIAAIIIGALFARDRELIHAARLSGMRLLAGSLAHDLRTPLASIHLQAELQEVIVEKLNNAEVQKDLKESLHKITRGIEMGNQLISMQLNNIQREKFDTHNFSIHSIKNLLLKTLDDYPLKDQQKEIIHLDLKDNFCVWIEEIAFKNLLWNLLKNSLDFISETGKGEISIWLEESEKDKDFNFLHIKDTAKGIYPKSIGKIFEPFYSDRKGGTGVGLAYCKLLMEAAGGDIYCQGKLNQYAHFIIKFPKID
jgi:signal transduction histidine kinase